MTMSASLCLQPVRAASGQLRLPGSKSISNRVLLLAALDDGTTQLEGLLDSDDTRVMLAALSQLGVKIELDGTEKAQIQGDCTFPTQSGEFFLGNEGNAFRPLTDALAVMGGDYKQIGRAHV